MSGNHGGGDMWLVKIDSTGTLLWQKCYGGTDIDGCWALQPTNDNGFIFCGGTLSNDGDVSGNHGAYDDWLVKIDSSGNLQWQKCLGGSYTDEAYNVFQTTDGGYIVGGISGTPTGNGDVTIHYYMNGTNYNEDWWIVKLTPDLLPLSLLSFKAALVPFQGGIESVLLQWITTNEVNVNHFNVQRSVNSINFNTIGSVKANGGVNQQEYNYTDLTPNPSPKERGTLFYRLEIMDDDGSKTYSEIREVQIQNGGLSIYPNPAHSSVSVQGINVAEIDIINNVGTTVITKLVNSGSGSSNTSISVSSLVAGSYTVTVRYNTGCYQSQTLIKN